SLTEIVTAIKKVSDIVAEIAAASREQATGLDQVNTAVGSMDEMTQRNGALVEQTSASAQALSNQATELAEQVGLFRTGAHAADASPGAAQAAAVPPKPTPPAAPPPASAAKAAQPKAAPARATVAAADDDWQEF